MTRALMVGALGIFLAAPVLGAKTGGTAKQVHLEEAERLFYEINDDLDEKYWQPRSYLSAHLVLMRFLGWEDVNYGTLAAVSGFGTSFAYDHDNFSVGWVAPPGCDKRIEKATGFKTEWRRTASPEEAWNIIKEKLDEGIPVRAPWLEEAIFAGYREAADIKDRRIFILCVPFAVPGKWWTWKEFSEWHGGEAGGFGMLCLYAGKGDKVPADESAFDTLHLLVSMAKYDTRKHDRGLLPCKFGLDGIAAYAKDIADMKKRGKEGGYFAAGWRGCHAIYPQWTCRQLTAQYLRDVAGLFDARSRSHLLKAAVEYDAAHEAWLEWEQQLGNEKHAPKNAWETPERRKSGAVAVRKALGHERSAVAEVEKALAAI